MFFSRGGTTSSVSFADSRCEAKEDSAEFAGTSLVGVLGPVEEVEEAGFEMFAAWTFELVVTFDNGFRLAVCRCIRNGITIFPDECREKEGRLALNMPTSRGCKLPSLSPSLDLRLDDEEEDDGGVGYAETVNRLSLATCCENPACPRVNDCGASGSVSPGVLGAVGKAAPPVAPGPNFVVWVKVSMPGARGMQGEGF